MSAFEADVMKSLGRIEQKVDTVVVIGDDHEKRLRSLEIEANELHGRRLVRARLAGVAVGATPTIATYASSLWRWFTGHR